jgi:cytochrome c
MNYVKHLAAAVAATALLSAAPAMAAGDPAAGEKVFKDHLCFACHKFEAGKNGVGPSLNGVFGRKAAQAPGYEYSDALKNSGLTWTPDNLDKWVQGPQKLVPGVKMMLAKPVTDATERANLLAYVQQESTK